MAKIKPEVLNNKRFFIVLGIIFLIFCGFTVRLVDWQIINAEYYRERANSSNTYFVKTDAIRGEIFDADGIGLALNSTGYRLVVDRLLIEKGKENELILELVGILDSLKNTWTDVLPIRLNGEAFEFIENQESQIADMRTTLKLADDASAQDIMNKMIKKYKLEDFPKQDQRTICSVRYNIDKVDGHNAKATPYILADNLTKEAVLIISEKSGSLKGVRVQTSLVRKYMNGELVPHLIGYTGSMSSEEYEKYKETYSMDAIVGKTGIEGALEDALKGTGGKRMIQMSRDGNVLDISDKVPAIPGNSVFLTISSKLQEVANNSLKRTIENARKKGVHDCNSGAVVVLDVKDFSILAAATAPGYDLNRFMEDKAYYSELYQNPALPLLNRAFSGAFAPGSIYKPLVACAALQSEKISPTDTVFCGGSFNYYTGYRLKCMGVHGSSAMVKALARSCNVYFAELGRRLGAPLLAEYVKKFGVGVKTGVEIGESKGVVASPEYCESVGVKWYESGSSQAAIGQHDNLITPLQLATYMATIANGGNRYRPHLVKKIMDYTRTNVIKETEPELVENVGVSEENINIVKEGMRQVVLSGTARSLAGYPIPLIAKTGTAENKGNDHTTFICAAPADDPKIAIAVVIANGKYGSVSIDVAKDILNCYFDVNT